MSSRIDDMNESAADGCKLSTESLEEERRKQQRFLSMAVYKSEVQMRMHTSPHRAVTAYLFLLSE